MARLYVGADRGPNRRRPARRGGAPLCAIDNAFGFRGACSASVRRVNVWWRTLLTIWRAKVLLRRKRKLAVRYASLTMVKEAMGAGQQMRRHVPPLLFLLAPRPANPPP